MIKTKFGKDQEITLLAKPHQVTACYKSKFTVIRSLCWGSICLFFAILITGCGSNSNKEEAVDDAKAVTIPATGWQVPVDVSNSGSPSRADFLNLGWNTFVAISWPSLQGGEPGQPNESISITDPKAGSLPAVWSTYLSKGQTFLKDAADPGNWTNPSSTPVMYKGLPIFDDFNKFEVDQVGDEFNQAFGAPLIDMNKNYVMFEIKINQSEFTYIDTNHYYDADVQKASFKTNPISFKGFPKTGQDITSISGAPVTLPKWAQQGAMEIKSSWRILTGKDDQSRYYKQKGYIVSPNKKDTTGPYTMGLVGLHMLRLTPTTGSTWYWATFEQIDNLGAPGKGGSFSSPNPPLPNAAGYSYEPPILNPSDSLPSNPIPVNVNRVYPIPNDVQAVNAAYQTALTGSVWQYYQLIEVQNPVPAGTPGATKVPDNSTAFANTNTMANATLETYQQVTDTIPTLTPQSCINCHAPYRNGNGGFPQGAPNNPDYQVFSFLLGDAKSGSGSKEPMQRKKEMMMAILKRVANKKP